jgi:hypothetical protein
MKDSQEAVFNCRIVGVAPLLMNKFPIDAMAKLENNVQKAGAGGGTPEEEAEKRAYRDDEGRLVQPGEHIYQALVRVASEFRVKGRGKKTYKDNVKGVLLVEPEIIPHLYPESGGFRKGFDIHSGTVVINRGRVVRHRPRLDDWALEFDLKVIVADMLPGDVLNAMLVRCGQVNGLGDYRPRFGRFMVERFEPRKGDR